MDRTHKLLFYDFSQSRGWADQLQSYIADARRGWLIAHVTPTNGPVSVNVVDQFRPTVILLLFQAAQSAEAATWLSQISPHTAPVILVTDPDAGSLTKFPTGAAVDVLTPPFQGAEVLTRLSRWLDDPDEKSAASSRLKETLALRHFVGRSPALLTELNKLPRFARSNASVFIAGETGTGKEICARAIHHLSDRAEGPFVAVNSGALPIDLIENELFGHEPGAYTGAKGAHRGLLEEAEHGTLFLDEIDALPALAQVKLLRLLQEREYRPLGSRKTRRADVRVIAASNLDAQEALRKGQLRADLYYRLNVLRVRLPPLRERKEDIPLLARHFLDQNHATARRLSPEALAKLQQHDWPGNIRELENVIERALLLSDEPLIHAAAIDLAFSDQPQQPAGPTSFRDVKARVVARFEEEYVRDLLLRNDGNITAAARMAVKNRRAFFALMRKHHISVTTTEANQTSQVKVVIQSDKNIRPSARL